MSGFLLHFMSTNYLLFTPRLICFRTTSVFWLMTWPAGGFTKFFEEKLDLNNRGSVHWKKKTKKKRQHVGSANQVVIIL